MALHVAHVAHVRPEHRTEAPVAIALAIALVAIAGLHVIAQIAAFWRYGLNTPAFLAQIEKLVYANNVDRAIKLCNAEPTSHTGRTLRALLTRANRVEELDLVYEEQLVTLTHHEQQLRGKTRLERALEIATLLLLVLLTSTVTELAEFTSAIPPLAVAALAMFAGDVLATVNLRHIRAAREAALTVRNLLYRRAQYVPPQHRPRQMTPEEVAAWRAQHTAFEAEVTALRVQGNERPAHEIHAERVDELGILKPL